ncbi:MAG: ribonuclease III [Oscillospiraceae bacterium]|nr:ribonuclease III [Oscillospiraceae bacterium]
MGAGMELQDIIGYRFRDAGLLTDALTHSSYANEHRLQGVSSNERLEFLGDSILGMTAAEHLYRDNPELPEGKLTRLRAALVCEESLAATASRIGLEKYLRLGRGEEKSGGRGKSAICADAVEALIAAIYLDGGRDEAERFITRFILTNDARETDSKTTLQELVQMDRSSVIEYRHTGESGPPHDRRFTAEVYINGTSAGKGSGRSKKEAEQAAAAQALKSLPAKRP